MDKMLNFPCQRCIESPDLKYACEPCVFGKLAFKPKFELLSEDLTCFSTRLQAPVFFPFTWNNQYILSFDPKKEKMPFHPGCWIPYTCILHFPITTGWWPGIGTIFGGHLSKKLVARESGIWECLWCWAQLLFHSKPQASQSNDLVLPLNAADA